MKNERQAKLKISNELLDAMLVGVKTQEDLWGKDGIITQINKALLERILNAEMEFHLNDTDVGRVAGNSRNGYGKKLSGAISGLWNWPLPETDTVRSSRR